MLRGFGEIAGVQLGPFVRLNAFKPTQQVAPQDRKGKSNIVDHVLTVEGPLEEPSMAMLTLITNLGYFLALKGQWCT